MSTIAQHAKAIFLEAVEKHSPDEWPEFLDEVCGDDQELRQRVEGLLQAHAEKDSLFDRVESTRDYRLLVRPGQMIGPYKIREQIGDGGMGVVYVAEQEKPLRRKVALKVIKPGMDSKAVLARFDAERNALAMMNHPNIAKVFDAGTTKQGHPFFVMELIPGKPITEYCDQKKLTISARLELFTQICSAVQHAHQKGVIHRDLKPSNILVTEIDGKPIPKVIDFGVAKALGANLTDRTVYTSFQALVGTPLYMSPEQTQLSGVDVDTSSDVYSLGILLYELLTGTTPLSPEELKQSAQDEVLRRIRETEPPRPSNRISTLGTTSSRISECRGAQPEQLSRLLRGDLDWIVMKALEKDRNRRYRTADAFAADIQRHSENEPVEARPPSTAYRLSRFYRRNRMIVGLISLVLVIAIAAASAITAAWLRAEKTVRELGESAYREAVLAAISGDEKKANEALIICERSGVPIFRKKVIEAFLAVNNGQTEEAIKLATEAWTNAAQGDHSDQIAARSLLAISHWLAGYDDLSFKHLRELRKLEPQKQGDLDRLFFAYANLISEPSACLGELESAPNIKGTPIGLLLASLARSLLGATKGDYELLEQSVRDNEYVRLLFRDNQVSLAYSIQAYAMTIALAKSVGRDTEVERMRDEALLLAELLESESGFPGGFYTLWMLYKSIGDDEQASRAIRQVRNHPGTYSFFLSADLLKRFPGPAAVEEFDRLMSDDAHESKYVRLARAHLLRDATDGERQIELLVEDCLDDPSPLIRRFALLAMCLTCGQKEIESRARRGLLKYSNLDDSYDSWGNEDCIRYLAGEYEEGDLRAKLGDRLFGNAMIELTIAMKQLAVGDHELARKHFQRCVDTNQIFTFDYGFAEAYLARAQNDPDWSVSINDN